MKQASGLGAAALLALLLVPAAAPAQPRVTARAARRMAGVLVDHTRNHGADRRIWSAALGERRALYVYLPPGFDPARRYPVMLWLHGINQDEESFPPDGLLTYDAAIAAGRLPPLIIVIPDGSLAGRRTLLGPQPLFLNSRLGDFEDYIIHDVWPFVLRTYPVHPAREAHIVGGFSGGGAAAYRLGIKYRDQFGVLIALASPLNNRWVDCRGRYFGNFDPDCWGWRTEVRGQEVVGRFYGVVTIRMRKILYPLFGRGPDALDALARENPIEMLDQYDVRPGELAMFVGYGGKDQFNMDAQVESFLYRARQRGLCVEVGYDPHGRHSLAEAEKFGPRIIAWLAPLLAPYTADPPCADRGP